MEQINKPSLKELLLTLEARTETLAPTRKVRPQSKPPDYLTLAAKSDADVKQERIAALRESIRRHGRDLGPRTWTRDHLYNR